MMNQTIRLAALLLVLQISAQENYFTKKGSVLGGYDVVTYFDGTVKKGNKSLSAEYKGATFLFSSQNNLDRFKENPKVFVPEYGGYCAYAMAVKGKRVPIDPKTYEIRNGKLYLFYNAWGNNTLDLWLDENPESLIPLADGNFENLEVNN